MSCPFDSESLEKLKHFTKVCGQNPEVLRNPEMAFFKRFIESFGGKIPETKHFQSEPDAKETEEDEEEAEEPESDLELDTEGCVEPDKLEDAQKMGDASKVEISEEDIDKANEKRVNAMSEFASNNYEKAIQLLTEAIELNPQSALFFAKRSQVYLKLMKPNACIKDCTRALELNPDSPLAYKFRGHAYRLLGEWEKAAKDLRQASIIDLDEEIDQWLKEVTPNAKKIEEHKLKQERKKIEREERDKLKRYNKAKEAREKAKTQQQSHSSGSKPNMGPFANLFQDPELQEAFKDPEMAEAFKDISSNPMNFMKYQSNPKVMALMNKLLSKSGMGFPGAAGFGGFPGGPPTRGFPGAPKRGTGTFVPPDDDNLD